MAYATISDVQDRMLRTLSESEETICSNLLDDAAVIIDCFNANAAIDSKKVVSCNMVIRAIGDGDSGIPIGASQGSMSGLGYSQSFTIGSSGSTGQLYLTKIDKQLLGKGNQIGSHSPLEDLVSDEEEAVG